MLGAVVIRERITTFGSNLRSPILVDRFIGASDVSGYFKSSFYMTAILVCAFLASKGV